MIGSEMMSFIPEEQDGFVDGIRCPYCKSGRVEYIGEDVQIKSGSMSQFDDIDGQCANCGKKVRIIEEVQTVVCGCYKGEKE